MADFSVTMEAPAAPVIDRTFRVGSKSEKLQALFVQARTMGHPFDEKKVREQLGLPLPEARQCIVLKESPRSSRQERDLERLDLAERKQREAESRALVSDLTGVEALTAERDAKDVELAAAQAEIARLRAVLGTHEVTITEGADNLHNFAPAEEPDAFNPLAGLSDDWDGPREGWKKTDVIQWAAQRGWVPEGNVVSLTTDATINWALGKAREAGMLG